MIIPAETPALRLSMPLDMGTATFIFAEFSAFFRNGNGRNGDFQHFGVLDFFVHNDKPPFEAIDEFFRGLYAILCPRKTKKNENREIFTPFSALSERFLHFSHIIDKLLFIYAPRRIYKNAL